VTVRWGWPVLLAALLVIGLLLAWADSTVFRPLFPEPFPQVRRPPFRAAPAAVPLPPIGPRRVFFSGLGPAGGLYTFWWFVSLGAGLILVSLAPLVVAPSRARRAAQRVSAASLPLMLAAGIATVLLALAATVLLRIGFVLLAIVPLVWALGALGALVGLAALALAGGRRLSTRLGPAPPLVAALAALLVLLDVSLVPVLGWVVLGLVGVTGLGVSVLTRLGSQAGWSLEELNW
jgi:hypothetical protein